MGNNGNTRCVAPRAFRRDVVRLAKFNEDSLEGGVFRCDRKCEEECRKIGPLPNLSPPLSHSECERGFVRLGEAKERGRKRAGGSQPKMCEVMQCETKRRLSALRASLRLAVTVLGRYGVAVPVR